MRLTILCAHPGHAGANVPLAIQDVGHISQATALLCEGCHEAVLSSPPDAPRRVWPARVQGAPPPQSS